MMPEGGGRVGVPAKFLPEGFEGLFAVQTPKT